MWFLSLWKSWMGGGDRRDSQVTTGLVGSGRVGSGLAQHLAQVAPQVIARRAAPEPVAAVRE